MLVLDLFIAIVGLVFGSFLYTMATRLAEERSVWRRSACDHCVQAVDIPGLIPVLGYLWHRGKCRHCGGRISPVYPLVELGNMLLVLTIYRHTGWGLDFVHAFLVFETLGLVALLDVRTYLIYPQPVIFGLAVQTLWLILVRSGMMLDSLLGLFLGAGIFHWIGYLYQTLRRRTGLGEGDAVLLGLIGYFFGWQSLPAIIFWGALLGIVGGGFWLKLQRQSLKKEIAFGPWLALAAFLSWRFPGFFMTIPFSGSFERLVT